MIKMNLAIYGVFTYLKKKRLLIISNRLLYKVTIYILDIYYYRLIFVCKLN